MTEAEILDLRTQLSDIYRDYRNVYLSKKYYARRLRRLQRFNLWYEIFLAVGTSAVGTSGAGVVAGWAIWEQPSWKVVWVVLGAVVAIASIIKPIMNLAREVERLTILETKFNALLIDFQFLIFEIKIKKKLDRPLLMSYKKICEHLRDLGVKEDAAPSPKVLRKLCDEVNQEVPVSTLWSPQ